ncbi:MAG: UTP--glucose-1-phosphate uridylyltransferase [Myxococcales bacterium]|jgi:UTP--glucose-1-phosphate uridylyltransferase
MDLQIDDAMRALLDAHGFDQELFSSLRQRMLSGDLSTAHNRIQGEIGLPGPGDIRKLPSPSDPEWNALGERGLEAMRNGELGCVVLAGGMATRFGGVVKAQVDALPGHSFLSLKLADIRAAAREARARVPVMLMSSFATHATLVELAEAESCDEVPVEVFCQFISLRLTPEGELFRDDAGALSPYAPGHGDMSFALQSSGALKRFTDDGGRILCMSNVDNLGATLQPAVVGAHLDGGAQMTVEVVARRRGEPGGAPARVDGRFQIVEDFRFPEGFDLDSIPYFNTNTFVLDATALDRDFPLTWFLVNKKVGARTAVQFEHLVGELSAFLDTAALEVPRDGPEGRFQPVKDPKELELRKPQIEAIMRARGVL